MNVQFISVSKNGKLVSKLVHQHTNNAENGRMPHVEDLTEVDIPELNIHEQIINNDGIERKMKAKRNVSQTFFLPKINIGQIMPGIRHGI